MPTYYTNYDATTFPPVTHATREEIMEFCKLTPTGFQRLVELRAIREAGLILPPSAREEVTPDRSADPRFKAWLAEQAAREQSEKLPAPFKLERSPEAVPFLTGPPTTPTQADPFEDAKAPAVIVEGPTEKMSEEEVNRLNGIKEPAPEELNAPILGGKEDELPDVEPISEAELERLTAPEVLPDAKPEPEPKPEPAPETKPGKKKGGR